MHNVTGMHKSQYSFAHESAKAFAWIGGVLGTPFGGAAGAAVGAKIGYVAGLVYGAALEGQHVRHTFQGHGSHISSSNHLLTSSSNYQSKNYEDDDSSDANTYNLKKRLKKLAKEELCLSEKPKMSDSLRSDLGADDFDIRSLKQPIYREFGVKIKKKRLEDCFDLRDVADLIVAAA